MRRGSRGAGASLCVAFVSFGAFVAGCSSSADADPPPPPVSPTAVTSSPPATPTTSGLTDAAAVAVAKAYYAAFNEGLKSRSSKKFRALTTGTCISCNKDAQTIDLLAKRDRTVDGGKYDYTLMPHGAVVHRFGDVFVILRVTSGAAVVRDSSGNVVDRFNRGKPGPVAVDLHPVRGRWLVRDVNG